MNEDLRKWFGTGGEGGVGGGGWDEYNTKGERTGKCARGKNDDGKGPKPKCLSKEKAAKMSKGEIAAAVRRKREKDPVADRPGKGGKPKIVSNNIGEDCWKGYKQVGMKKKGKKQVPNCVPEGAMPETIDPKKHREQQRAAKIRNLAQKGSTEGERSAAEKKTKGPKMFGENIKIVDKILLEMEAEVLTEKNKPTNPKLWAKWKSKAKAKFDVYPSAYANGWAAKGYKSEGGGWKSVSEETIEDLNGNSFVEVVDLIKPDPLVSESCCSKCGKEPCECETKKSTRGGSSAKPGPDKNYVKPMSEAVRIPAKTGNIVMVTLNWRGKYYGIKMFFPQTTKPNRKEVQDQIEKVYPGGRVQSYYVSDIEPGEQFLQVEDWQKVNRQDKTDGLSQKAVNAYRKENPGSKLQTAVTEKNPEGKRAERRKLFCRRMTGMKKRLTSAETARDPDSRINKALRRWNCN